MGDVIRFPDRAPSAPGSASPEYRAALEGALERVLDAADHLVAQLNRMDGDPDLEPGGDDEPSLASPIGGESQVPWCAGGDRDLEQALSRLGKACRALPAKEITSRRNEGSGLGPKQPSEEITAKAPRGQG